MVNLNRRRVVNLNRPQVVSLNRREVVNLTGACTVYEVIYKCGPNLDKF